jgi:hypothetical protein
MPAIRVYVNVVRAHRRTALHERTCPVTGGRLDPPNGPPQRVLRGSPSCCAPVLAGRGTRAGPGVSAAVELQEYVARRHRSPETGMLRHHPRRHGDAAPRAPEGAARRAPQGRPGLGGQRPRLLPRGTARPGRPDCVSRRFKAPSAAAGVPVISQRTAAATRAPHWPGTRRPTRRSGRRRSAIMRG